MLTASIAQQQNGQTPVTPAAPEAPKLAEPPKKPEIGYTRPPNYSAEEAVSDPNSPSARYNHALIRHQEEIGTWQQKMIEHNATESAKIQEAHQKQMQQMNDATAKQVEEKQAQVQNQQVYNQLQQDLQIKHGLTPSDVGRFMQWQADDKVAMELSNWVAAWRFAEGQTQMQAPLQYQPVVPAYPQQGTFAPMPMAPNGMHGTVPVYQPVAPVPSLQQRFPTGVAQQPGQPMATQNQPHDPFGQYLGGLVVETRETMSISGV